MRTGLASSDPSLNPRVYIAAPLFNPQQLAAIDTVDAVLRSAGFDTYSPARDGVMLAPDDPAEKRDEVYHSNMLAIRQSDLLVALLDTKDTGTIWELGAAMAFGMRVIAVTLTVPQMNVMLERGVIAHVRSLGELDDVLEMIREHLLWGRKSTNDLRALERDVLTALKANYSYAGQTQ